eukprot:gnl/MRDRNA2_/MRDRNA2_65091_c0_seq1.p2 gnl/MRDRNA2_/MRDRNA2_65091_c0~~gnl/MRDRNA2_/MRDRNA2_65091_c0_seq1.p2  ORF type:complete len:101 (-),score=6.11 gnl/MRDRNA2_/MRDRNA2_65091_c0_seq1:304-606(-)
MWLAMMSPKYAGFIPCLFGAVLFCGNCASYIDFWPWATIPCVEEPLHSLELRCPDIPEFSPRNFISLRHRICVFVRIAFFSYFITVSVYPTPAKRALPEF